MNTAEPPKKPCHFIAFYSYKGGVGRTLALANVGRELVRRGKRVVLMDFDLEAPGLDHFEALQPKVDKSVANNGQQPLHKGLVEYLSACLQGGPPQDLDEYCYAVPSPDTNPSSDTNTDNQGQLWVMPAGRHGEPHYQNFLEKEMNWQEFYSEHEGWQVMENLRGHLVDAFAPDYVLMDARTGLTEVGGLVTHQLADVVVLLFGLNDQNLSGTETVYRSLGRCDSQPKRVLVASPVPAVTTELGSVFDQRMQRIAAWGEEGDESVTKPLIIPFQAGIAQGLVESIVVDDDSDPFAFAEPYRRLTRHLEQQVNDPEVIAAQVVDVYLKLGERSAIELLEQGLLENPRSYRLLRLLGGLSGDLEIKIDAYQKALAIKPDDCDVWNSMGAVLGKKGDLASAMESFNRALEINPKNHGTLNNLGVTLYKKEDLVGAIEYYEKALAISPDSHEAWKNLGVALGEKGDIGRAIESFRQALVLKPKDYESWSNLGVVLNRQGDFDGAIKNHEKALAIRPDAYTIWRNIGSSLAAKGDLDRAIESFEQALVLQPDDYESCNNIGILLGQKGDLGGAIKRYEQALAIQPEYYEAWNNLGTALHRKGDFDRANESFERVLTIKPSDLSALINDAELALVQGDYQRLDQRLKQMEGQVTHEQELFVIIPWLRWLAEANTEAEPSWVKTTLQEYTGKLPLNWDLDDAASFINDLPADKRSQAETIMMGLRAEIDYDTLLQRLNI